MAARSLTTSYDFGHTESARLCVAEVVRLQGCSRTETEGKKQLGAHVNGPVQHRPTPRPPEVFRSLTTPYDFGYTDSARLCVAEVVRRRARPDGMLQSGRAR